MKTFGEYIRKWREDELAVILSEFERLYDPNHTVPNNLETLDSIEEVRIIKEALK